MVLPTSSEISPASTGSSRMCITAPPTLVPSRSRPRCGLVDASTLFARDYRTVLPFLTDNHLGLAHCWVSPTKSCEGG